jgi:exopolyphosphatase/guanosine-5'-triphosphate,3'-diphosphate pyrophosphatase
MSYTTLNLKKYQEVVFNFPLRLGIIDLGTNSVRFDVYDVDHHLKADRIHREKIMVRLGDGLFEDGKLDKESITRTLDAFTHFKNKIEEFKVDKIVAFATSALRDSVDGEKLARRIKKESKIELHIISGMDEALLIARGILNNETTPNGLFALIDIGGGSTEISICHKKNIIDSYSFNLGANRLQQIFLKTIPPTPTTDDPNPVNSLRHHIRALASEQAHKRSWPHLTHAVGSSGTIRAFGRILRKQTGDFNGFKKSDFDQQLEKLIPLKRKELINIPGMEEKRADLIVAGGILLDEILKVLQINYIQVTKTALRDGILDFEIESLLKSNIDKL